MKILVTNTVVTNGGDAAILSGVLKLLREAFGSETQFLVCDSSPQIANELYSSITFRNLIANEATSPTFMGRPIPFLTKLTEWRLLGASFLIRKNYHRAARILLGTRLYSSVREYATADMFVSTGGTYLSENYDLRVRLLELRVLLALGKPLLLMTQSMGPFKQKRNKKILCDVLQRAWLVLLRDDLSLRHIRDIGVRCNSVLAPDTAFALQFPKLIERKGSDSYPRLAISVRRWKHFKSVSMDIGMRRYKEAVANLVSHFVTRHQAHITFLSTCQGVAGYAFDDSAIADDIVTALPCEIRDNVVVNHDFHTPEMLVAELQKFDIVVSTRMHFAILGLVAGVPVVPISYEFKTRELFTRLGLEHAVIDIEEITPVKLIDTVQECFDNYLAARDRSTRAATAEYERTKDLIHTLRSAVKRTIGIV